MKWFIGLSLNFLFVTSHAWAISPEIPTLSYDVFTTESIISLGDLKYRKVEYKGETFFLRLLEAETTAQDLEILCQQKPVQTENQAVIATAVTKRSSLFIDGLRQTCRDVSTGQKRINIDPNIQVGFLLDDTKKGWLKNKKVFWNPDKRLIGVGGEW